MAGVPIIIAAFANDSGRPLQGLKDESDAVSAALLDKDDAGCLKLRSEQGATIDSLFKLVSRYEQDLVMLHYGGHADGTALDLQAASGGNEVAHVEGLAQLLGRLPNLKLVLLNGCATQGQVELLLGAGVAAVIATSAPVEDDIAQKFARAFYEELAKPDASRTIDAAFQNAQEKVKTIKGSAIAFETRGMTVGTDAPPAVGADKWGLYSAADKREALAWSLPTRPPQPDGAAPVLAATAILTPNLDQLSNQVALLERYSDDFRTAMDQLRANSGDGTPEQRFVRIAVINAYPSPIGVKMQQAISSGQMGLSPLAFTAATYDMATRLIAFALVAQLWDLFEDQPGKVMLSDAQWSAIAAFNALDEAGAARFDYLALAVMLTAALVANQVTPYMAEAAELGAAITQPAWAGLQEFMNALRGELFAGPLDPARAAVLSPQADQHLDTALKDLAFVTGYKLATIKDIQINRVRRKQVQFMHRAVVLDNASSDTQSEDMHPMASYADNRSVILLKKLNDVTSYINLSPFIIDKNALTGNPFSNLYFLRWFDSATDRLHYRQISRDGDELQIWKDMPDPKDAPFPPVLALYQDYRVDVARR